jgi:glycosyltransferase involved in cell wall biosynthesis
VKILYLTHQYFPRHVGGTEVYTRGLVRRARAAGHQPLVVTCHEIASGDPADFRLEQTAYEGVPLAEIHFNLGATRHPARAEYDNAFVRGVVAEQCRSFKPDLVHVMHAMKLSGAAMEACAEAGVPTVVTLCDFWFICPRHTLLKWDGAVCDGPDRRFKCLPCVNRLHGFAAPPWPKPAPRRLLGYARDVWAIERRAETLKRTLSQARRVFALSEFQKRMFVRNGFPPERIEVMTHGLETEGLVAAGQGRGETGAPRRVRRIGFIGSLVRHKGAHVLLEALALAPRLDVECLVYGPLREGDAYVNELRERAGRDRRVRLMGGFAPSEMGRVLREFDLLAMPALWYENEPLVVKAALYVGCPVLASRIGSLAEMVEEGRSGWLVEPDSPQAWARAITDIASAPLPASFSPIPVKTMDENARELFQVYEAERRR